MQRQELERLHVRHQERDLQALLGIAGYQQEPTRPPWREETMKLGFTGTRNGMTRQQYEAVGNAMSELEPTESHHGDCIGADADFHSWADELGGSIVIHPGPDGEYRAHCRSKNPLILPEKTHFARNRDIVDATDILLATPRLMTEEQRGGTWYTIGYARKKLKPVVIVWPDGTVTRERCP